MQTRIVKLDKGLYKVEYMLQSYSSKLGLTTKWHEVEKNFRTKTKAEEFIREKLTQYVKSHR